MFLTRSENKSEYSSEYITLLLFKSILLPHRLILLLFSSLCSCGWVGAGVHLTDGIAGQGTVNVKHQ